MALSCSTGKQNFCHSVTSFFECRTFLCISLLSIKKLIYVSSVCTVLLNIILTYSNFLHIQSIALFQDHSMETDNSCVFKILSWYHLSCTLYIKDVDTVSVEDNFQIDLYKKQCFLRFQCNQVHHHLFIPLNLII